MAVPSGAQAHACSSGPDQLTLPLGGGTKTPTVPGENPFFDIEETIRGVVRPPFGVSPECYELVTSLLDRDPAKRMTIAEAERHPWCHIDASARLEQVLSAAEWSASSASACVSEGSSPGYRRMDSEEIDPEERDMYNAMFQGEGLLGLGTSYSGNALGALNKEMEDTESLYASCLLLWPVCRSRTFSSVCPPSLWLMKVMSTLAPPRNRSPPPVASVSQVGQQL